MNWLEVGKRTLPSVAQLTIRALRNASRSGATDIAKARQSMLANQQQLDIARDAAQVRDLERVTKRLYEEAGTTPQEVANGIEEQELINRPRNSGLVHRKLTPAERKRYENPMSDERLEKLLRGQLDKEQKLLDEIKTYGDQPRPQAGRLK